MSIDANIRVQRKAPDRIAEQLKRGFKRAGKTLAEGMLIAGLAGPVAVMAVPKTAQAEKQMGQVTIAGVRGELTQLETSFAKLDRETEPYRKTVVNTQLGPVSNSGELTFVNNAGVTVYTNTVFLSINPLVTPRADREVSFEVHLTDTTFDALVNFPPNEDRTPNTQTPGAKSANMNDFAAAVQQITGQKLKRVKIVIEKGIFEYNGNPNTVYTNAYILPVNSQGQIIGRQPTGEYLAAEVSYFAGTATGGGKPIWLKDVQATAQSGQVRTAHR